MLKTLNWAPRIASDRDSLRFFLSVNYLTHLTSFHRHLSRAWRLIHPPETSGQVSSNHKAENMVDDAKLHQFVGQMLSDLGGAASVWAIARLARGVNLPGTQRQLAETAQQMRYYTP